MASSVTPSETRGAITRFEHALKSARRYANMSRASSTWRAYENDARVFQSWCRLVGRLSLPADTDTVAAFIAAQADSGKAISTIRRRLSAIRLLHIANEMPSPHASIKVSEVLHGIARDKRNVPVKKALPVLDTDIQRLIDSIDVATVTGARDRALLLIGFDAAMRRSELVGIQHHHISYREHGLIIEIPYSKTDQTGTGAEVGVLVRPDSPYCPVRALEHWKLKSGVVDGAVFRRVFKNGVVGSTALTGASVSLIIKNRAQLAGFDKSEIKQLSGHSYLDIVYEGGLSPALPTEDNQLLL